jgi:hypothetical protein
MPRRIDGRGITVLMRSPHCPASPPWTSHRLSPTTSCTLCLKTLFRCSLICGHMVTSLRRFGSGDEDYILDIDVWRAVGSACTQSGGTIPAAFGCHVPNLASERPQTTAESTLIFTTLLAPALLRNRFKSPQYYNHFIKLVNLINICMALELHEIEIQMIREQFAKLGCRFRKVRKCSLMHTSIHRLRCFSYQGYTTDTHLIACTCAPF